MKKLVFVFFAFLLMIFACSKKSSELSEQELEQPAEEENIEPENEIYFTLNVAENYFLDQGEGWIIIHDVNNGNVIDYQLLRNGTIINFEKPKSGFNVENNITLIKAITNNGNTYRSISTYTFIPHGAVWKLYNGAPVEFTSRGNSTGEIEINANYLISPVSYNLSNKFGSTLSGGGSSSTLNQLTNINLDNIPLFEDNRYLFSLFDSYGDGKYIFLDNLIDGQTVNFDRTQMKEFDKTIPIYIPEGGEYFTSVFGYEQGQEYNEGNGYILNMIFPFDNEKISSNSINLGYLNSLEHYITTVNFSMEKFNYRYKKYGEIPEGISFDNMGLWKLEVTDDSLNNFQFNGPSPNLFTRQSHHWQTISGTSNVNYVETNWTINQSRNYYTFNYKLPDEILAAYPNLDINNLSYKSSSFYLDEYNYPDFVNALYVDSNPELFLNYEFVNIEN